MSGWTVADGRELRNIRVILGDIRDALLDQMGTRAPAAGSEGESAPLPGQIALDECEHRIGDTCCIAFGETECNTCPTPAAKP